MNKKVIGGAILAVLLLFGAGFALSTAGQHQSDSGNHGSNSQENSKMSDAETGQVQETNQVTYKGFAVVQESIKVKKGTTVTWTNEDVAKHDVTPTVETADFKASELFGKGETHQVTFNTPGTYEYYCSPHPYMKGTVEVTE